MQDKTYEFLDLREVGKTTPNDPITPLLYRATEPSEQFRMSR